MATGTTASRPDDNSSGPTDFYGGLVITPNTDLIGVELQISANASGFSEADVVRASDDTVIGSVSNPSSPVTFDQNKLSQQLFAGNDYYVRLGNGGSQYTAGEYDSPSFPYTSADVDIENGVSGTFPNSNFARNYKSVTALVPTAPAAPSNLSASASADDISLSWTDNADSEDGFYVYRARSSGTSTSDYTRVATLGSNTTSYTDTALDDGEQYFYRVSAYNSFGESDLTNEADATTTLPAPSAVTITVTADDDITISWTDNSDNEDQFRVEVSEDGGAYTAVGTVGANTTTAAHAPAPSVDTLQYRVRAETEHVDTPWASSGTVSTNATGLAVTSHGTDSISLSWTGADQADGYEVVRAQAGGSTLADYSSIATVGGTTTSYQDTGLENGERYFYRVRATYDGGTDSPLTSEVDQITDLSAPASVSLDTSVENEISLSWTNNDNSTDGEVEIYRSTDGTLGAEITGGLPADGTSFTDTGLADGEQYFYTVRRVTDHTSSDATQQSGVTVLPAPTNLTVDAVTDTTADLSWTDTHDNGQTRVEFKPASTSTWQTFATLAIGTESETVTGLRNGEQYDARVVATTEHANTEDS